MSAITLSVCVSTGKDTAGVACAYTAGGASLSTVAGLEKKMGEYTKIFGVQPSQLVPTLNWFSTDFACVVSETIASSSSPARTTVPILLAHPSD